MFRNLQAMLLAHNDTIVSPPSLQNLAGCMKMAVTEATKV